MFTYNPVDFNTSGISSIVGDMVLYNDGQLIDFGSEILAQHGIEKINAFNQSGVNSIVGDMVYYKDGSLIDFGSDLMGGALENVSVGTQQPEDEPAQGTVARGARER